MITSKATFYQNMCIIDHVTFKIIDSKVRASLNMNSFSYRSLLYQLCLTKGNLFSNLPKVFLLPITQVSSIYQSFPHQNFEITNSPKFFPTRILHYMVYSKEISSFSYRNLIKQLANRAIATSVK